MFNLFNNILVSPFATSGLFKLSPLGLSKIKTFLLSTNQSGLRTFSATLLWKNYQQPVRLALVITWFRVQYDQYFTSFSYFSDLFHEPWGEWNKCKIWETRKLLHCPYWSRNAINAIAEIIRWNNIILIYVCFTTSKGTWFLV